MKQKQKQKIRLILNMALMVFTLFALVVSMVAWFTTNQHADIQSLSHVVNPKEFYIRQQPKSYMFSCATKIQEVDGEIFNTDCISVGEYLIEGADQIRADILSENGVLGYVLVGNETSDDYYTIITDALKVQLKTESLSGYTYEQLRDALREINLSRTVGTSDTIQNQDGTVSDVTKIRIVCWTEYGEFADDLNDDALSYFSTQGLKVKVRFIS